MLTWSFVRSIWAFALIAFFSVAVVFLPTLPAHPEPKSCNSQSPAAMEAGFSPEYQYIGDPVNGQIKISVTDVAGTFVLVDVDQPPDPKGVKMSFEYSGEMFYVSINAEHTTAVNLRAIWPTVTFDSGSARVAMALSRKFSANPMPVLVVQMWTGETYEIELNFVSYELVPSC